MRTNIFTAEGEIGFRSPLKIRPIPGRADDCEDGGLNQPTKIPAMPVPEIFVDSFVRRHGSSGVPGQVISGFRDQG